MIETPKGVKVKTAPMRTHNGATRVKRYAPALIGAFTKARGRFRDTHDAGNAAPTEAESRLLLERLNKAEDVLNEMIVGMENVTGLLRDSVLEVRTAHETVSWSNERADERMKDSLS